MNEGPKRIKFFEQYKYGPITKLINYGIFPYIFLVHIFLLLFSILQSISITNGNPDENIYNLKTINSFDKTINELFLHNNNKKLIHIFTPNELRSHIKQSIDNYYNIDKFFLLKKIKNDKEPIIQFVYLFFSKHLHENKTMLVKDFIEYDNKELKKKLMDVKFFTVNYTISMEIEKTEYIINICTKYDLSSRGQIEVSLKNEAYVKKYKIHKTLMEKFYNNFIHYCVLFLSIISLMNTWKHISKISEKFVLSKLYHSEQSSLTSDKNKLINPFKIHNILNESSIYYNPLFDKNEESDETEKEEEKKNKNNIKKKSNSYYIYSYLQWSLICLIGNIFQILGSFMYILSNNPNYVYIIGIGVFFACFNMTRYIVQIKSFNTIYEIIIKTFPIIINYLIGVFPIWLSFLFFGVCVFWESKYFRNLTVTIRTLLSLMFGDDIALILTDLYNNRNYFISVSGFIYGLTFISLEIMVILNIFIEIIHNGFEREKEEKIENNKKEELKNNKKRRVSISKSYQNLQIIKTPSISKTKSFRSLISKRLLTNKNKAMSLNIKRDEFQNFSYSHKKQTIGRSLKNYSFGGSILEKEDEKSYSSSSNESSKIFTRKVSRKMSQDNYQIVLEKINQIFNSIGQSFDKIKEEIDVVENISNIKKQMLSELKTIKNNIMGVKQELMKNK